jgi:RHS repeat-associated protein
MTDATQAIVFDRVQQPFGEPATTGSPGATNNLRFPGQYADSESLLNYNLMRDYDPTLGRYIESDPIGLRGASISNVNLYGYAKGNPTRWIDKKGTQTVTPADIFNPDGTINLNWLTSSTQIFKPGTLRNPNLPLGVGKYTTGGYCTPSGTYETHFYYNAESGEFYYGYDYKTMPSGSGPNPLRAPPLIPETLMLEEPFIIEEPLILP